MKLWASRLRVEQKKPAIDADESQRPLSIEVPSTDVVPGHFDKLEQLVVVRAAGIRINDGDLGVCRMRDIETVTVVRKQGLRTIRAPWKADGSRSNDRVGPRFNRSNNRFSSDACRYEVGEVALRFERDAVWAFRD